MDDPLLVAVVDALNQLEKYLSCFILIEPPSLFQVTFQLASAAVFHNYDDGFLLLEGEGELKFDYVFVVETP